jgi:predicted amidohydrolase
MNGKIFIIGIALCAGFLYLSAFAGQESMLNLIPNGNFQGEAINGLPAGWVAGAPRPCLAPKFALERECDRQMLFITGGSNPDCVGWVSTRVRIDFGKTYLFHVRFKKSSELNPLHHMQFQIVTNTTSQGITEFHRLRNDWIEGETRICFPGKGEIQVEVQIIYRLCAKGKAWIENISLTETAPVPPRWVRVACTQGPGLEDYGLKAFGKVLDAAGEGKVDLVLLPEYFSGEGTTETLSGASVRLMSEKARQYRMFVAGTICRHDPVTNRLYNSALLFNRDGEMIGCYDKIHLYGPELNQLGVTPGGSAPVFRTDFGKVGFMTCSDSWFPDVAELVALKGADILLFPNLGYDRALMHARSLDNCVNILTSTRSGEYGFWDAMGRDIIKIPSKPGEDSSFKDVVQIKTANTGVLMVTIDLNAMRERHVGNQKVWLEEEILREKQRWWVE